MLLLEARVRAWAATLLGAAPPAPFTVSRSGNSVRAWARRAAPVAASLVGLWLCVRFVGALDWRAAARDIRHVGVGAGLLILAPVVGNFVHMLGWRALLPSPVRPRLGRALAIFLAAQAGNEVGLGVLGESIKVSELPSEHRSAALRAVLLDNLSALAALFAVVLSIAAFLGSVAAPHASQRLVLIGSLSALGVAIVISVAVWAQSSHGSARGLLFAFVAHYVGKLWIVAEFALVLALLGTVTLRSSALLGLVSTLASAAGAAIPGQLGVLEAALKGSASSCGLAACTLVSVALLRRARSVLWVALGALLFWQLRSRRAPEQAAPHSDREPAAPSLAK